MTTLISPVYRTNVFFSWKKKGSDLIKDESSAIRIAEWEWQNGRMTEWQNDRMIDWQNDRMIEWQNDRLTEWQNDRMTEW